VRRYERVSGPYRDAHAHRSPHGRLDAFDDFDEARIVPLHPRVSQDRPAQG
jgi:hypothetical protein